MTTVREQGRPLRKGQASEAPSPNGNHESPLKSNESEPFKAPEGPIRRPKAPLPTLLTHDIA